MDVSSLASIEVEDDCTVIRFLRELELSEVLAVMDQVAARDDRDRRVWNLSVGFSLAAGEIREIAAHGRRIWPGPARVAYVASADLHFGLLRMLEAFRSEEGYQTRVFRTEGEAKAWCNATDD